MACVSSGVEDGTTTEEDADVRSRLSNLYKKIGSLKLRLLTVRQGDERESRPLQEQLEAALAEQKLLSAKLQCARDALEARFAAIHDQQAAPQTKESAAETVQLAACESPITLADGPEAEVDSQPQTKAVAKERHDSVQDQCRPRHCQHEQDREELQQSRRQRTPQASRSATPGSTDARRVDRESLERRNRRLDITLQAVQVRCSQLEKAEKSRSKAEAEVLRLRKALNAKLAKESTRRSESDSSPRLASPAGTRSTSSLAGVRVTTREASSSRAQPSSASSRTLRGRVACEASEGRAETRTPSGSRSTTSAGETLPAKSALVWEGRPDSPTLRRLGASSEAGDQQQQEQHELNPQDPEEERQFRQQLEAAPCSDPLGASRGRAFHWDMLLAGDILSCTAESSMILARTPSVDEAQGALVEESPRGARSDSPRMLEEDEGCEKYHRQAWSVPAPPPQYPYWDWQPGPAQDRGVNFTIEGRSLSQVAAGACQRLSDNSIGEVSGGGEGGSPLSFSFSMSGSPRRQAGGEEMQPEDARDMLGCGQQLDSVPTAISTAPHPQAPLGKEAGNIDSVTSSSSSSCSPYLNKQPPPHPAPNPDLPGTPAFGTKNVRMGLSAWVPPTATAKTREEAFPVDRRPVPSIPGLAQGTSCLGCESHVPPESDRSGSHLQRASSLGSLGLKQVPSRSVSGAEREDGARTPASPIPVSIATAEGQVWRSSCRQGCDRRSLGGPSPRSASTGGVAKRLPRSELTVKAAPVQPLLTSKDVFGRLARTDTASSEGRKNSIGSLGSATTTASPGQCSTPAPCIAKRSASSPRLHGASTPPYPTPSYMAPTASSRERWLGQ